MGLIAFTGKKRSGKSTASTYVQSKHQCERVNFKDALVHELMHNFPELIEAIAEAQEEATEELWTIKRLFDEKPPLMRTLMQNYGTNVRRHDYGEYWVDRWKESVWPLKLTFKDIVVDDVRFLNEAQAVRELGGIVVRIVRRGQESLDTHVSEQEMDDIEPDYTIAVDSGDLAGLEKQLDDIIKTVWQNTSVQSVGK